MGEVVRIHKRVPKAVGMGGEARIVLADALRETKDAVGVVIVVMDKEGKFSLRAIQDSTKIEAVDVYLRAEKVIGHHVGKMLD